MNWTHIEDSQIIKILHKFVKCGLEQYLAILVYIRTELNWSSVSQFDLLDRVVLFY